MKVLIPIKTGGLIGSKAAIPSTCFTSRSSSSYSQVTAIPSQNLYEKSAPKALHFKFNSTSLAMRVSIQSNTSLEIALRDLWNIYISLYRLMNTEKKDINLEFEKIINSIQKLASKLTTLTSQKKLAGIINSIKIIHGKIQIAVNEAYQNTLVMKIFNMLEIELNNDMTQYVHVLKTLSNESFYLRMQKTISFLLRKVVKKYSTQKTISTVEKSFLAKLNISEISKEFIRGVQDVNIIMDLAEQRGGTYFRYFRQQKQVIYGLIGGGCAGSVIHWGIELLSSSSNEKGNSSRLLLDSKEMLASFMHQEIPESIRSLNFLGGEPIFNKQLNLYQLFYDMILSNSGTLQEFNLLSDGPVFKNMFGLFSEDENESILVVNFENTTASASNDQTSHFIGLAKVGNDDNALYYLSDAEFGDFNFNDKNKFKEFFEEYCNTMQYDQYNSYWIMDIKPALKKIINDEVVLSSNIEDVIKNYTMGMKETDKKEALAERKELQEQPEEKTPRHKVSNH